MAAGYAFIKPTSPQPDRAPHRPVVQHQLVAAHVDEDLARVGSGFVALGRDHDADPRRLFLVHGEEKEVAVSEAEFLRDLVAFSSENRHPLFRKMLRPWPGNRNRSRRGARRALAGCRR